MGGPESAPQQRAGAGQATFGALLRRYRLAAGFSQERLAERAGISVQALSALKNGRRQAPYRHTVALLAKAMDLAEAETALLEARVVRGRQFRRPGQQPVSKTREPLRIGRPLWTRPRWRMPGGRAGPTFRCG